MRKLRQQFDETRRQVQAKERELELVKKKLELVQNEEYDIEDGLFGKEHDIEETKTEMEQIKEAADFELMKQRQY